MLRVKRLLRPPFPALPDSMDWVRLLSASFGFVIERVTGLKGFEFRGGKTSLAWEISEPLDDEGLPSAGADGPNSTKLICVSVGGSMPGNGSSAGTTSVIRLSHRSALD